MYVSIKAIHRYWIIGKERKLQIIEDRKCTPNNREDVYLTCVRK